MAIRNAFPPTLEEIGPGDEGRMNFLVIMSLFVHNRGQDSLDFSIFPSLALPNFCQARGDPQSGRPGQEPPPGCSRAGWRPHRSRPLAAETLARHTGPQFPTGPIKHNARPLRTKGRNIISSALSHLCLSKRCSAPQVSPNL